MCDRPSFGKRFEVWMRVVGFLVEIRQGLKHWKFNLKFWDIKFWASRNTYKVINVRALLGALIFNANILSVAKHLKIVICLMFIKIYTEIIFKNAFFVRGLEIEEGMIKHRLITTNIYYIQDLNVPLAGRNFTPKKIEMFISKVNMKKLQKSTAVRYVHSTHTQKFFWAVTFDTNID